MTHDASTNPRPRAELFERWAASYDRSVASRSFPFGAHDRVMAAIIEGLAIEPGVRVLELGAGSGLLTERLLAAGAEVIALDRSPAMHEHARRRAPHATRVLGDVTHPGWAAAMPTVDRIAAAFLLHEFPLATQLAVVEAAAARLSGDGPVVLGDVGFTTVEARDEARVQWGPAWDPAEHYWAGTELQQAFLDGWIPGYAQLGEYNGVLTLRRRGPVASGEEVAS
jgi:putative AdoMet-dependent methyltransferase